MNELEYGLYQAAYQTEQENLKNGGENIGWTGATEGGFTTEGLKFLNDRGCTILTGDLYEQAAHFKSEIEKVEHRVKTVPEVGAIMIESRKKLDRSKFSECAKKLDQSLESTFLASNVVEKIKERVEAVCAGVPQTVRLQIQTQMQQNLRNNFNTFFMKHPEATALYMINQAIDRLIKRKQAPLMAAYEGRKQWRQEKQQQKKAKEALYASPKATPTGPTPAEQRLAEQEKLVDSFTAQVIAHLPKTATKKHRNRIKNWAKNKGVGDLDNLITFVEANLGLCITTDETLNGALTQLRQDLADLG